MTGHFPAKNRMLSFPMGADEIGARESTASGLCFKNGHRATACFTAASTRPAPARVEPMRSNVLLTLDDAIMNVMVKFQFFAVGVVSRCAVYDWVNLVFWQRLVVLATAETLLQDFLVWESSSKIQIRTSDSVFGVLSFI